MTPNRLRATAVIMIGRSDCGELLRDEKLRVPRTARGREAYFIRQARQFDDQKNSLSSLAFGVLNELSGAPKVAIISSSS